MRTRAPGRGQASRHGRRQARRHVFIAVERRVFDAGLEHEERVGLYLAAAIVLVEPRQEIPSRVAVAVDLIVHRGEEFFGRATAADQGFQPGESGTFTAHARLGPLGRLTCCHTTSSFSHSLVILMTM